MRPTVKIHRVFAIILIATESTSGKTILRGAGSIPYPHHARQRHHANPPTQSCLERNRSPCAEFACMLIFSETCPMFVEKESTQYPDQPEAITSNLLKLTELAPNP
jgi:hypothetical protein